MSGKKPFCEEVLRTLGEIESLLSLNEDAGLIFEKKEVILEQIRCLSRIASDKIKINPLRTLSAIKEMNSLVILDLSIDELCRKIVEILVNKMGFCNASMLLFNHEKEILELSAAFGRKDSENPPDFAYNRSLSFKPGSRAAGRAFLEGHTVIIEDVGEAEEADLIQTSIKIETLVSFPVIVESEKIGVINASYESKKEIDEQNRFELEAIKGVISYILLAYTKDRSLKKSSTELIDKIRIQGTYYSQILESLPVAVCELYFDNNEFYISQANPAFYRISGTDKTAENPKLSVFFQEKEAYLKAVNELIMKKKYVFTGAMLRKFDGSELIGDIFLEQASLEEKNLYSIVIIDKTDEYRLEQRLIQSDKISSLGRLAEGISHDIKNIFSGVNLALQALQKKLEGVQGAERYINMISDSTNRGITLSNDLLEFAHGKAPELRKIQIETVIENCVNVVKSSILPKINLKVVFTDEPLPGIKGDLSQLEQAIFNILINAKDSIIGKGEIIIRAGETEREKGKFVSVEITDNGIGIPKNIIKNIFDPFFTTKTKKYSSGLGLSITYRIVKNHGGEIYVRSTEGQGSVFTMEFPIYTQEDKIDPFEAIIR